MVNYNDNERMKWLIWHRENDLIGVGSVSRISLFIHYLLCYLPAKGLILLGNLMLGQNRLFISENRRLNGQ